MGTQVFLKRLSWMLLIPLVGLIYVQLNYNNGNVHNLMTALDRIIPFIPYFVVPYVAWYGVLFFSLTWFAYKNDRLYYRSLASLVLGMAVSYLIFFVFQTTVPRPVIEGHNLFNQLTKIIYAIDNPYNAFPSLHVLTSYIIYLGSQETKIYSRFISRAIQIMTILVILSTIFLKQHTLLDVAGGIFIGGTIFNVTGYVVDIILSYDISINLLPKSFKHIPGKR